MDASSESLSARLRGLTDELRTLDGELKLWPAPDARSLQEFREALDSVRMTAWTVGELLNAHEIKRDPGTTLSFLTSERLRRVSQLVQDPSAGIGHQEIKWQTDGIHGLRRDVGRPQERL